MSVSLSIKGVPEAIVERLRRRAEGNHRSLQRELMAIVEAAVQPQPWTIASPQLPPRGLRAAESEAVWQVSAGMVNDKLLEELDTIVSGSHFGEAPLLTRDQLHDRVLAREIDFDSRQAESRTAKPRKGSTP